MRDLGWLTARPVAHRGLHAAGRGIIENTSSAFAGAIERNFAIECDVRLTSDGEAVVFHDGTLERLTLGTGHVGEFPARELQQVAFRDTADRIQTLGELLDQVGGRVPLIIELKSSWDRAPGLARRVAELCLEYRGPVATMSFDPRPVAALAHLAPGLARGIVGENYRDLGYWNRYGLTAWQRFQLRHLLHAHRSQPHFIAYDIDGLPAAAPLLMKALGRPLLTWTVRTAEQRARAARYADQIIFEGFLPE
ncbi:MAG: glycerophosphodiester phosphodiesterase family protein [Hyphomicrobiales bacterium]